MTDSDKPAFAQAAGTLSLAVRESNLDAAVLRTYFTAMTDLPVEVVVEAAGQLALTAKFFPKVAEWRNQAILVEHQRLETHTQRLRELHKAGVILCNDCQDTGWSPTHSQTDVSGTLRWQPCGCRALRRLEVLGRRPLPLLPATTEVER